MVEKFMMIMHIIQPKLKQQLAWQDYLLIKRITIVTYKKNRLVIIFQPHRYSRVKQFFIEFAKELSKADFVYLTNIYGAGEKNIDKINSNIISDEIIKKKKNVKCLNNNFEIINEFYKLTQKGDLIVNMGAGDCHNFWQILNNKN